MPNMERSRLVTEPGPEASEEASPTQDKHSSHVAPERALPGAARDRSNVATRRIRPFAAYAGRVCDAVLHCAEAAR